MHAVRTAHIGEGPLEELSGLVAEHLAESGVHLPEPPIQAGDGHADRRVVECLLEPLLGLAELPRLPTQEILRSPTVPDFPLQAGIRIAERHMLALAFHRIADRSGQDTGVELVLDEVVLRPEAHRVPTDPGVVQARQDHDRDRRGGFEKTLQTVEPVGVGQVEVEQDAVDRLALDAFQGLQEPRNDSERELWRGVKVRQDELGVTRIVLHEED